ncbi:MAG: hypothetical protein GY949_22525 [Gammaproteobacteria bacterium]|nr:hypothetical protein [Gammaproteobacteria bacterium]
MDNVEWVPIVMFIGLTVVVCVFFWLRYRARNEMQQTFRLALDKGQELTPEVIDRLGHPKPSKDKDMRLGIVWLALAVALVSFGFGIPDYEGEVSRIFMGISAFPFAIGFAYMILYKFTDRG